MSPTRSCGRPARASRANTAVCWAASSSESWQLSAPSNGSSIASSVTTARRFSTRRTARMARGRVAEAAQPQDLITPTSMAIRRPQALRRVKAAARVSSG